MTTLPGPTQWGDSARRAIPDKHDREPHPMANLGQMLKQAQEVQARMESLQNELAQLEVAGSSGGGMVRVTLTGKGEARGVKIDPTLCGPDDVEVLEDLLLAAFNDAKSRADAAMQEKISAVTGGLQMPAGLKLPF